MTHDASNMAGRVTRLEQEVQGLTQSVGSLGGKVDSVMEGVATIARRLDANATAATDHISEVRNELRMEADRKAGERSALLKDGMALLGGVALIVTAFGGPYVGKISGLEAAAQRNFDLLAALNKEASAREVRVAANAQDIERLERDQRELAKAVHSIEVGRGRNGGQP